MKKLAFCLISVLLVASNAKKHPPTNSCKAYFIVTEQDAVTVNLAMVGLNEPQRKWYEKSGGEFPGICLVNGDATGKRVTLVPLLARLRSTPSHGKSTEYTSQMTAVGTMLGRPMESCRGGATRRVTSWPSAQFTAKTRLSSRRLRHRC